MKNRYATLIFSIDGPGLMGRAAMNIVCARLINISATPTAIEIIVIPSSAHNNSIIYCHPNSSNLISTINPLINSIHNPNHPINKQLC